MTPEALIGIAAGLALLSISGIRRNYLLYHQNHDH